MGPFYSITSYSIRYGLSPGFPAGALELTVSGANPTVNITGLHPFVNYSMTVVVITAEQGTSLYDVITPTTMTLLTSLL